MFEQLPLGEGTYGAVCQAEYRGEAAAAKVFTLSDRRANATATQGKMRRVGSSTFRLESARREVAASAAFPADQNILRLLDVFVRHDAVLLVYPRFDSPLHNVCMQRTFVELEVKLVMITLLHACAHLHMHGLVHTDVKPANVLINGAGLSQCRSGCISCYQNWCDAGACLQFSKDVGNLPCLLKVVLSDPGSVEPCDPSHRAPVRNIEEFGVQVSTLSYRAPECLLGDSDFTFAIDARSLGCLGVEIIQGQQLFPATQQVDLLFQICTAFGSPKPGGGSPCTLR